MEIGELHATSNAHYIVTLNCSIQRALVNKRSKLRHSREERERNYRASRGRAEREHQAQQEDRERKLAEWKERTDTLDRQRVVNISKVSRCTIRLLPLH